MTDYIGCGQSPQPTQTKKIPMTISELISELASLHAKHGNVEVITCVNETYTFKAPKLIIDDDKELWSEPMLVVTHPDVPSGCTNP